MEKEHRRKDRQNGNLMKIHVGDPILIVKIGKEDSRLETCDEDDLAVIVPLVKFLD